MSNLETLLTAWLNDGEVPAGFQPETRIEEYLVAILEGVDDDVTPKSRADVLLDAIATKYAGYADGIEELRGVTGMTAHHVPGGDTPEEIAAFLRLLNTLALQDLAAKGATGVSDNTTDILDAYANLPSGGAELNIAYGNTAPEDTTKLWVKTAQPQNITVDYNPDNTVETVYGTSTVLPEKMDNVACGVVGDKCYFFGGASNAQDATNTIRVYDTDDGTLVTLPATLSIIANGPTCGVIGSKCYVFGGWRPPEYGGPSVFLNTISVFDTETETLTTLPVTLPTGASLIACAVVGDKCYLFGGTIAEGRANTVIVFDADTETINTLPVTLPTGARGVACAVVGTKIYLFGGDTGSGSLDTINVFDTDTNTITTLSATLPTAASQISCATVGTKIYILGGKTSSGWLDTINVFDAETETLATLTDATLLQPLGNACSGQFGLDCYIFGGCNTGGRVNTIYQFNITFPLAEGDVFIHEDMLRNKFDLLTAPTKVTVGVAAVSKGNASGYAENAEALLYDGAAWQPIT